MSEYFAHIIVIDGEKGSGRKTLSFELAITLLYNHQQTALLLKEGSPLSETIRKRREQTPNLPQIPIITDANFAANASLYKAIIIPEADSDNKYAEYSSTYITLLKQNKPALKRFRQNQSYLSSVWELKKKIAARRKQSLNWVICENNLTPRLKDTPDEELLQMSKLYGFRVAPPLNMRAAYKKNITGLSAQDKSAPEFQKMLTYEDICTRREITRLAEFIFS